MELQSLQQHIQTLAMLESSDNLMLSCYVNFEPRQRVDSMVEVREAMRRIKAGVDPSQRRELEDARSKIFDLLGSPIDHGIKGVAVFARAGEHPFFLSMQFKVPLPNWLCADLLPNIYHLVELKDTYDRYVVMIAHEDRARILEVNLGAVTKELWTTQPALRQRVGREWTRDHYQNHRRDRGNSFIKEKIEILGTLLSAGGHTHLLLAGNRKVVARLRQKLPPGLVEKLIDVMAVSSRDTTADVVSTTLSRFVEWELQESLATSQRLRTALQRGGLAVSGTEATLAALMNAQVDILVLADFYDPAPGWSCLNCDQIMLDKLESNSCPNCHRDQFREINLKEEMVRLAECHGSNVEIVRDDDTLGDLGGVGCLLRYLDYKQFTESENESSYDVSAT